MNGKKKKLPYNFLHFYSYSEIGLASSSQKCAAKQSIDADFRKTNI